MKIKNVKKMTKTKYSIGVIVLVAVSMVSYNSTLIKPFDINKNKSSNKEVVVKFVSFSSLLSEIVSLLPDTLLVNSGTRSTDYQPMKKHKQEKINKFIKEHCGDFDVNRFWNFIASKKVPQIQDLVLLKTMLEKHRGNINPELFSDFLLMLPNFFKLLMVAKLIIQNHANNNIVLPRFFVCGFPYQQHFSSEHVLQNIEIFEERGYLQSAKHCATNYKQKRSDSGQSLIIAYKKDPDGSVWVSIANDGVKQRVFDSFSSVLVALLFKKKDFVFNCDKNNNSFSPFPLLKQTSIYQCKITYQ